jgi:hypothetical protein
MKKQIVKFFSVAMIIAAPAFLMTSCESDPCKDVTCENAGVPTEDGEACNCVCATGYEGVSCETLVRANFVGNYNVSETCNPSGSDTYSITISAPTSGGDDLDVVISNLYNAGFFVNGEVNSDGGITIPNQSFGTGSISGSISNTGAVSYTITAGGASDACSFSITL